MHIGNFSNFEKVEGAFCFRCVFLSNKLYEPRREKTLSSMFVNNKGADQPAHQRSLVSAFVICLLEIMISKLATSKISIF